MKKRRPPLPEPPRLGGIVIDGSNVVASGNAFTLERLDQALDWCRSWRGELPVQVFFDASTARRLRPEVQDVLRARCADVTPERARHVVCPRGESADAYLLEHAGEHAALVISNDRYFDHEELRTGLITLQFRCREGVFEPFDVATWFRPSGGAQRVDLADLA